MAPGVCYREQQASDGDTRTRKHSFFETEDDHKYIFESSFSCPSSMATTITTVVPFNILPSWALPDFIPPPKRLRSATDQFQSVDHEEGRARLPKLGFLDHVGAVKQHYALSDKTNHGEITDPEDEELADGGGCGGGGGGGPRLVQLLISCAEAVACRDRLQAATLLEALRSAAAPLGTAPFQRVASCFAGGLADRLELLQSPNAVASAVTAAAYGREPTFKEALKLAYEILPYVKFGHYVANSAILEAFEGENTIHVLDLGMTMGLSGGQQWRSLLDAVATTRSSPRRVRITGISANPEELRGIGEELKAHAAELRIDFKFHVVVAHLEALKRCDLDLVDGEALAVNASLELHRAVKESRGALHAALRAVHGLRPRMMTVVEQDAGHNGPFFLGRFMEALHYYSAIFDSLDATSPAYDTRRAKIEQFYLGEEIRNIVGKEGPARVERHERADQWRRRMSRAGFQPWPVNKMIGRAKKWLMDVTEVEGFTVAEDKAGLSIGWKSKPILSASCWKC